MLAALPLLFMLPATASAQQVPPHVFIGTVTIDGLDAPIGTAVTASIDGVVQGSTAVQAGGTYTLMVNRSTGNAISFKIGNLDASEKATWEKGGGTILDLNASVTGGAQGSVSPSGAQTASEDGDTELVTNQDTDPSSFEISNLDTANNATWEQGGATIIDLTTSGADGTQGSAGPPGPQGLKGGIGGIPESVDLLVLSVPVVLSVPAVLPVN